MIRNLLARLRHAERRAEKAERERDFAEIIAWTALGKLTDEQLLEVNDEIAAGAGINRS